jgi:CBS domain-containing protein
MKNYRVKDLMVPISEYATVRIGTSLIEAIQVLEKAQTAFTASKYEHRAILVLDNDGSVVGKISQLRALRAIDREFDYVDEIDEVKKYRFSDAYIAELRAQYRTSGQQLSVSTLKAAAKKKVEEFMQRPTSGEFVSEDSELENAIHKLVAGTHLSLLVTSGEKIVGVLRTSDVFAAIFHEMTAAHVA